MTWSCRHSQLRQLPCDNPNKAKRGLFGFLRSSKAVPCVSRYDWSVKEPCGKCRRFPLERNTSSEGLAARAVPAPQHYAIPQPVGGIYPLDDESPKSQSHAEYRHYCTPQRVGGIVPLDDTPPCYAIPKRVGGIVPMDDSPGHTYWSDSTDSCDESGANAAAVTNKSGRRYDLSNLVRAAGFNAGVSNNSSGHSRAGASASARHTVSRRQNVQVASADRTRYRYVSGDGDVYMGSFIQSSTCGAESGAYGRSHDDDDDYYYGNAERRRGYR